jgi:hypothetical protein
LVHPDFVAGGFEAVTGSYEARGGTVRSYVARGAERAIRKKLDQDAIIAQTIPITKMANTIFGMIGNRLAASTKP